MADALVSMATASIAGSSKQTTKKRSGGSKTLVRIRVDLEALMRGHRDPGETCEIPGISSVPVKAVREILGDSLLELVITKGKDVRTVCSDSRYIKKALRIALEERDQTCSVPGCSMSDPLEVDHWETDYAKHGKTRLDNLARLCPYHHHQKTYRGWRLEGGPGHWRFVGPDPPASQHPEHLSNPEHNGKARSPAPDDSKARRAAAPRATGSTDRRGKPKQGDRTAGSVLAALSLRTP